MTETACKSDEDYNSIWGGEGKTAKMKAAQQCHDSGYYNHTIKDCGGWKFKAVCSGAIPDDWSRPYSDESAKEKGFLDRNFASLADCKKKGYSNIDAGQWRDKGDFAFSVKCINKVVADDGNSATPSNSGIPCKKDEDFGSIWGKEGKTAKMKAAQACRDKGFYDHQIIDCGNFRFSANCSGAVPADWSRPYSDESAQEKGFENRNKAALADCKKKGFSGIDEGQWRDKGEFGYSLKCVKGTSGGSSGGTSGASTTETVCQKDENFGSVWGTQGKTAQMKAAQECSDRGFYDHQIVNCGDWKFKAKCSGKIPDDWSRPFSDEAAQEKGFENRNKAAEDDCRKKGFDGIDAGQYRDKGSYGFSVKCKKVKWSDQFTACDGNDRITYYSCDDWLNNDPESCIKSKSIPEGTIVDWKMCALGSSPGGLVPNKGATSCPVAAGQKCMVGQECYAVIKREKDQADCASGGLFGGMFGMLKYLPIVGGVVVGIIVLFLLIMLVMKLM